jgi:hypothetical protein
MMNYLTIRTGKIFPVFIILIFISLCAVGQEKHYIQLNGIVMNEKFENLPFTHVIVKNKRGAYSDKEGLYSVIVEQQDTVLFSCVGYKDFGFIIPDSVKSDLYTVDVVMINDTILIDEVIILPWRNYQEFKRDFIALKLPNDDLENARRNIALIKTQMRMNSDAVASVNFKQVMQEEYNKTAIQGQFPSITLTNPLRWAEFIKAIKDGEFKQDK